ncbi:MAG: hypothetical protein IJP76_09755 [Paludibacteraceae bacterium]|jgi:hypothetical protein|nr:hypothetical protein [Paludibacteraceae bacterium]MBR1558054.1 hypothetical protein [Prevotella sp.]
MVKEIEAQEEREKYIKAWNDTMLHIWQERITLLEVIDTGRLLASPVALPVRADGRFVEVTLSQEFLEYGLWQDYGVGRETPRGNSGDIGHAKVRQRRPWFSKKYYASVLNLRDFFGDNLGREFQGIMADTFERLNKLY